MTYPRRIYGVDFSGAKDAGRRIWVTSGIFEGEALHIEDCHRGAKLAGSSRKRGECLLALKEFIASSNDAAFGLDFPFGLPKELVEKHTWEDFVTSFPSKYNSPEECRKSCREASSGKERKRDTDLESKTPFCVYNLRLFRQTYYGICDLLAPLVKDDRVRVLPMQKTSLGKPWILEICPASTLKTLDLYEKYKWKKGGTSIKL